MFDDLWKWGWGLTLLLNLLLAWALWTLRTAFVPRKEFSDLTMRVALIEQEIKHLPTQRDFIELRDLVLAVKGQADVQQQLLSMVAASQRRIENFMLGRTDA